jgi:hypothetical protein
MIDPRVALQLKQAGLEWRPTKRDNFMIPNTELAQEIFTLNDQTILIQNVKGQMTVMFHGSMEWALDDVLLADVLWLPSETQLREEVQLRLGGESPMLALQWTVDGYRCTLSHLNKEHSFEEASAEHAYALALLFLLQREQLTRSIPPGDADS